jgi:hypothetical protein
LERKLGKERLNLRKELGIINIYLLHSFSEWKYPITRGRLQNGFFKGYQNKIYIKCELKMIIARINFLIRDFLAKYRKIVKLE